MPTSHWRPRRRRKKVARASDVALCSAVARALTSASSASDGGCGVNAIASSAPCNERIGSCSLASATLDVSSGAVVMSCSTIVMSTASRLASVPATEPKPPGASRTRCVLIPSDWASTSTVGPVGAAGAGDGAAFGDRRTRAITPITAAATASAPNSHGHQEELSSPVAAAACVVSVPGAGATDSSMVGVSVGAAGASVSSVGASVAGGRTVTSGIVASGTVGACVGRGTDDDGIADPDPEPQPTPNSTITATAMTNRTQRQSTPPSSPTWQARGTIAG